MAGPSAFVADPNVFLGGQTAPAHHLRRVMIPASVPANLEKEARGIWTAGKETANRRPEGLDLRKLKGPDITRSG
jgi:hypothetical protein